MSDLLTIHAGHGPYPGRTYGTVDYLNESIEARKVVRALKNHIAFEDITVNDPNLSQNEVLRELARRANAKDRQLNISIHLNASANRSATGLEILHWPSETSRKKAEKLSGLIVENGYITNVRRPVERNNLYFLNNTKAVSLIIECAFCTSLADASVWDADRCALILASALKDMFRGLEPADDKDYSEYEEPDMGKGSDGEPVPYRLYKVQAGAFYNKGNAEKLAEELRSKGYDCFVQMT